MDPENETSEDPATALLRELGDRDLLDLATWERYLGAFDRHGAHLYRLALLLFHGNRQDAEDVVQELFLAAHAPWRDGRIDDLGAYLRASLVNRISSAGRHRSVGERFVRRKRADEHSLRLLDDVAADRLTLQAALDCLPPRQRLAVVLRYYEGLSVKETAEMLGVREGTVKSQVFDALRSLRSALEVAS